MQERLILIAEDDQNAIESWGRDIHDFNENPSTSIRFVPLFAKSKRSALNVLDRTRVNCAAVDLRLPDEDKDAGPHNNEPLGNNVLDEILRQVGVPAVVYSGYIQEASEAVKASRIRVMQKQGGGAMEALTWLSEYESLMSAMEETRKRIAQQSARLFSESIWPRWEIEWKNLTEPGLLAGVLTRQLAAHIAEELSLPPHLCHPEEFYIIPPLTADRLNTGDLVMTRDVVHVVVTPRCNMARDNYPSNLILALCKQMEGPLKGMRDRFKSGDTKKEESAAKELHQYATQGHAIATHFLPPCGERGPWLADFREIVTIPSTEVPALLQTRFASVAPQFIPNLVQRYSTYLGRIGQPDLDCNVLRSEMCK